MNQESVTFEKTRKGKLFNNCQCNVLASQQIVSFQNYERREQPHD